MAIYTPYRNGPSGQNSLDVCIYEAATSLQVGKTVSYVVLPDISDGVKSDVPALHVFAAAIG